MEGSSSGGDLISGDLGAGGRGNAVGKGNQQVSIDLRNVGERDIADIVRMVPRLNEVLFGDGYKWAGIVRKLEDLSEKVERLATREEVNAMAKALSDRIAPLEDARRRKPIAYDQSVLIGLMVAVLLMALAIAYGAYVLGNGMTP
jgi:hypothetical protein